MIRATRARFLLDKHYDKHLGMSGAGIVYTYTDIDCNETIADNRADTIIQELEDLKKELSNKDFSGALVFAKSVKKDADVLIRDIKFLSKNK